NPDNPGSAPQLRHAEAAARVLGLRVQALEARNPAEIDAAFAAMRRETAGALELLTGAMLTNQRNQVAALCTTHHLRAISGRTQRGPCPTRGSGAPWGCPPHRSERRPSRVESRRPCRPSSRSRWSSWST